MNEDDKKLQKQINLYKRLMILPILFILSGFILIAYPIIKNKTSQKEIEKEITKSKEEQADTKIELYKTYNNSLQTVKSDAYLACPELIGFIEIPSINCSERIYRLPIESNPEKEEEILSGATGHMFGSDLPTGEKNTNCVICGHNGVVGKDLFLNLLNIEIGAEVKITVNKEVFSYTVVSTETVEPTENIYFIDENETRLTLVTCTPIGVNSHRFIVHCVLNNK